MDSKNTHARRTGYAFQNAKTMKILAQKKLLQETECDIIFEDIHPNRDERNAMISNFVAGDILVLCEPSLLASGKKDTVRVLTKLAQSGILIEVLGYKAHLFASKNEIENFANEALEKSRISNAKITSQTRLRSGPRGKLADLTSDEWDYVKWWWYRPGVKQQEVVDFCNGPLGLDGITRNNINNRLKSEVLN